MKAAETLMVSVSDSKYKADDGTVVERDRGQWVYKNQGGVEIDNDLIDPTPSIDHASHV